MAAFTAKENFEYWGAWAFRGIVCLFCTVMWTGITELKEDVKLMREERSGVVQRIISVEHKAEENKNSIDRLYMRLIDHEIKHQ
jgi:hypothetical protein